MQDKKRNILLIAICTILVFIDQITKRFVITKKNIYDFGIFQIREVHNTGASFGILQNSNILLIIVAIIALIVIAYYFSDIDDKTQTPTIIVFAGIIGNLTDRITFGYVIDFIDFKWWPVFNIADMCIVIGVFWIAINVIKDDKLKSNSVSSNNSIESKKKNSRIR